MKFFMHLQFHQIAEWQKKIVQLKAQFDFVIQRMKAINLSILGGC